MKKRAPHGASDAEHLEFHSMPIPECGCTIWTGWVNETTGYGAVTNRGKYRLVHREAWKLANGPIPKGMFVLHRCDVRTCINPDHLFLGTHQDNMDDMKCKRRAAAGARNGSAKLKPNDVLEIRASSLLHRELSAKYGVALATISFIKTRRIWRHI